MDVRAPPGGQDALGVDVGTTGGEWVFKQDGMLFGPVPAKTLVDKLYAGELDGETPIAPEGGEFRRLREVPFFVVHVAKAEAKRRVDHEAQRHAASDTAKSRLRLFATLAVGLVVVGGAVAGVRHVVLNRALANAPAELADVDIEISPPLIALAAAAPRDDSGEFVDYVDVPDGAPDKRPVAGTGAPRPRPDKPGGAAASTTRKPFDEENITEAKYDQGAINRVVQNKQSTLFTCLKAEVGRDPNFRGQVPLTFTIANDGSIATLWIDKPGYKTGPLYDCMKQQFSGWRFPSFEGERPSVSLSFKVGK